MRPLAALLVPLVLVAAGCVDAPAGGDVSRAARPAPLLPAFPQEHDHLDASLHRDVGVGLAPLGYHSLAPGTDGADASARGDWANSEIIVRGDWAFVGYLGAPWLFAIVDVGDAAAPVMASAFAWSNAWAMDLAVSEDGDWVFASVYPGAAGTLFATDYLVRNAQAPQGAPLPGVLVVDVRDKAAPVASGFLPVHGFGPHTATYHRYEDGREIVVANKADAPPGNAFVVAEVVPTPTGGRTLKPLSHFVLDGPADQDFPHDVDVQRHPLDGRTLLYAAYFDQGLVVVDLTDPAKPALVSRTSDVPEGEEVHIHDVHPFPRLVGGRHYTLTGAEIPGGETTGHLRVFDTTDPAKPALVASWRMPGEYVVDKPFGLSMHNFVFLPDGTVALAHGHAGVWLVRWHAGDEVLREPRALAYRLPHAEGATPASWSPVHGVPWVWGTGVDAKGNVWAADVASGLHGFSPAPDA